MPTAYLIVVVPGSESDVGTTTVSTDTTPDPFSFTAVTGAALSSVYTSNTITISGIDTSTPVSISNGTYCINGGAYTSAVGSVVNGDTLAVRAISSSSNSVGVTATLTVGGTSAGFTVTTQALSGGTAGQAIGLLLSLTKAA